MESGLWAYRICEKQKSIAKRECFYGIGWGLKVRLIHIALWLKLSPGDSQSPGEFQPQSNMNQVIILYLCQ